MILHYRAGSPAAQHHGKRVAVLVHSRAFRRSGPRNWLVETVEGEQLVVPRWNVRREATCESS